MAGNFQALREIQTHDDDHAPLFSTQKIQILCWVVPRGPVLNSQKKRRKKIEMREDLPAFEARLNETTKSMLELEPLEHLCDAPETVQFG
jgi:hypothetical protein